MTFLLYSINYQDYKDVGTQNKKNVPKGICAKHIQSGRQIALNAIEVETPNLYDQRATTWDRNMSGIAANSQQLHM